MDLSCSGLCRDHDLLPILNRCRNLNFLDLSGNDLGDEGVRNLVNPVLMYPAEAFANLEELHLSFVGVVSVKSWLKCAKIPSLKVLKVSAAENGRNELEKALRKVGLASTTRNPYVKVIVSGWAEMLVEVWTKMLRAKVPGAVFEKKCAMLVRDKDAKEILFRKRLVKFEGAKRKTVPIKSESSEKKAKVDDGYDQSILDMYR